MSRILLCTATLIAAAGAAGAQSLQGQVGPAGGPSGTNLSTGGVTLPFPHIEIVPTTTGFVGATIETPPAAGPQDRPGISGMSGSTLRRDLNGGMQASGSGPASGSGSGSSSAGRGRAGGNPGVGGSSASAAMGTRSGSIDEQRGAAQEQLRGFTGGLSATDGVRANRVPGDRLDGRQGRMDGDASGSLGAGASSSGGLGSVGSGSSLGRSGSVGGGRSGGAAGGAGGSGGSSGGGSGGGGGS